MANSVRIGGARVDLTGQDAQFQQVMRRAGQSFARQERQLASLKKRVSQVNKGFTVLRASIASAAGGIVAGAFSGGAILRAAKDASEFSTSLVEASRNTGILATKLEAIRSVLEQDGIGFGATDKALLDMSKNISNANLGLATYQRAFDSLGLSVADLRKLAPEQQFATIGEALASLTDQTDAARVAQDIFGRAGKQLIGTFRLHRGNIADVITQYDRMTKATDENYLALKDYTGALTELDRQLRDETIRNLGDNVDTLVRFHKWMNDAKIAVYGFTLSIVELRQKAIGHFVADLEYIGSLSGSIFKFLEADVLDAVAAWKTLRKEVDEAGEAYDRTVAAYAASASWSPPAPPREGTTTPGGGGAGGKSAADIAKELEEAEKKRIEAQRKVFGLMVKQNEQYARQVAFARMLSEGSVGARVSVGAPDFTRAGASSDAFQAQVRQNERAVEENKKAAMATEEAWRNSYEVIATSGANAFAGLVTGAQSFGDAMRSVAQAVVSELIRILIVQKLVNAALGAFGGGGGFPGSTFAAGGGTPLASGGSLRRGGLVRVHAGETIALPQDAQVYPRGAGGMAGGGGVTLNFNGPLIGRVESTDGPGVRKAAAEAITVAGQAIRSEVEQALTRPSQGRQAVFGR